MKNIKEKLKQERVHLTNQNRDNSQWNDADDSLPEENVYVVCRYDDYYFVGYI